MALDLSLLKTHADCDEVLTALEAKLDTYDHQDINIDYADRQADRTSAGVNGRLVGVNALIASYTATLAQADLPTDLRKQTASKLRKANDQKDNLTERNELRIGSAAFLTQVTSEQVDGQVAILTRIQTLVKDHRETLPS